MLQHKQITICTKKNNVQPASINKIVYHDDQDCWKGVKTKNKENTTDKKETNHKYKKKEQQQTQ